MYCSVQKEGMIKLLSDNTVYPKAVCLTSHNHKNIDIIIILLDYRYTCNYIQTNDWKRRWNYWQ